MTAGGGPARRDARLEGYYGEVHMLVGDAGTGKRALLQRLAEAWKTGETGVRVPAASEETDGETEMARMRDSTRVSRVPPPGAEGIGWLDGDVLLVDAFTVLENLMLGREHTQGGFLRIARARERAQRLRERYGLRVSLEDRVEGLDACARMEAALLSVVYHGCALILLDEPEASLPAQSIEQTARIVRTLASEGRAVVWATQDAELAQRWGDRFTVWKDGRCAGTAGRMKCSAAALRRHMGVAHAGTEKNAFTPGRAILTVRNVTVNPPGGEYGRKCGVHNVSFSVREGEILAVLGVPGNGETLLARAIAGLTRVRRGQVYLDSREITHACVKKRFEYGLGFVPAERTMGYIEALSLTENLTLRTYDEARFAPYGFLRKNAMEAFARRQYERISWPCTATAEHGEGERMRAILARETEPGIRLLMLHEPMRGLNTQTREAVYALMCDLRAHGCAVLFLTASAGEALAWADRILVLHEGTMTAQVEARHATEKELGYYMTGEKRTEN